MLKGGYWPCFQSCSGLCLPAINCTVAGELPSTHWDADLPSLANCSQSSLLPRPEDAHRLQAPGCSWGEQKATLKSCPRGFMDLGVLQGLSITEQPPICSRPGHAEQESKGHPWPLVLRPVQGTHLMKWGLVVPRCFDTAPTAHSHLSTGPATLPQQ